MKQFSILLCLFAAVACHGLERTFQITFRVVDDEGTPVAGAKTSISWENANAGKPSERIKSNDGLTDKEGRVTLAGKTFASGVSYGANKDGHYGAWGLRYYFKDTRLLRWQPWNPTIEVVLKRKKNPVPMYAKRMDRGLDILNEPYGYDLQVGDWVKPHGKGVVSDFIFTRTLVQRSENDFDYQLKVSFPNTGDGIQRFPPDPSLGKEGYQTLMLYEAPADGYASEWLLKRSRKPGQGEQTTFNNRTGYYFRVRTELDKSGKVVRALYGKIYGDFFSMVYYLNPDGTRNIECDPKRNLLRPSVVNNNNRSTYEVGP